ncbi:MAG: biotin--[acetyl-CoA-carboxylase] ligase [Candidatus Poribacteria bacterium]|nr:biotin--[acetyl-CoA-carboxylase] ligase [Candidatus Poribacteria bacterium]
MTEHEIRYGLRTRVIGQSIEIYSRVESTNQLALRRGYAGAAEGTIVLAEYQTAGRGRHGRVWHSPHGSSLLASLILRHRLLPNQLGIPSLMGAVSITNALRELLNLPAMIRWPNDVLVCGKKISGVLAELDYDQNQRPFFIVGFGVNVNIASAEFPLSLRSSATSIQIEFGRNVSRVSVLRAILHHLEEIYSNLKLGSTAPIIDCATDLSTTIGKKVQLETLDGSFNGIAERIDAEGKLTLRDQSGRLHLFSSGDVVHAEDCV